MLLVFLLALAFTSLVMFLKINNNSLILKSAMNDDNAIAASLATAMNDANDIVTRKIESAINLAEK